MEEWDSKGGFNIKCGHRNSRIRGKGITDLDMTEAFSVEPDKSIPQYSKKKGQEKTSPHDPVGDWSLKRNKTVATSSTEHNTDMVINDREMV